MRINRKKTSKIQFIVNDLVSALIVCFFVSCGKTDAEIDTPKQEDCGAQPTLAQGKIGQIVNFVLSPPGAVGPIKVGRTGQKYAADPKAGFESGFVPIIILGFKGLMDKKNSVAIQLIYEIRPEMPNMETRTARQFPGQMTETVKLEDAEGKTFSCSVTTQLKP